jgi:hypothetical protein
MGLGAGRLAELRELSGSGADVGTLFEHPVIGFLELARYIGRL